MEPSSRRLFGKTLYSLAKPYLPSRMKPLLVETVVQTRKIFGKADALPQFIIIGAQRSGSTSLYDYLVEHPNVAPALHKEIHFFDSFYERGLAWYKAHFQAADYLSANDLITGEASPYYILSHKAAARLATDIPEAKIIALLRNPINRAYSHHNLQLQRGHETRSFAEAVKDEIEAYSKHSNLSFQAFREVYSKETYLSRCFYAAQLAVWFDYFPPEQILTLKSEDLYENRVATYQSALKFLGLPEWEPEQFPIHEQMQYAPMSLEVRKQLIDFFAPHNERLDKLIGRDMQWDRRGAPREESKEPMERSVTDLLKTQSAFLL